MNNQLVDLKDVKLRGYQITEVFKDTIWATFVDEHGEPDEDGFAKRGEILVPDSINKSVYRVAEVIKAGPDCSDGIEKGAFILLPPQVGLIGIDHKGKKTFFVTEGRIMAVVEKVESEDE